MAELPDFENDKTAEGTGDGADGPYNAIHSTGFKDFLFKEQINRAIVDVAFEHPSEVQHECIPQATLGTDILCQAKSGMGKTAVFVLTTLQQLDEERPGGAAGPEVLVVCHTRELAVQIEAEYKRFSKYLTAPAQAVFGGIPVDNDRKTLKNRKPRVVVGTPGRLQQLIRDQALDLSSVKHFVLDECDKCLEKADMRNDIQQIFFKTPKKKQVMMFTATMSGEMADLCKKFMQDPHTILVSGDSNLTLQGLLQYRVDIDDSQKNRKLGDLLDKLEFNQIVIFVKSVQRAKALNQLLNECSFPSICIHSQMKQEDRTKLYKQFKDFQKRILVATDLFGRGIDIERVNVVVNYDAPAESDPYLHRVGRAGRFGTKGLAITFVSSEEDKTIMGEIQERFSVTIEDMPESIDPSAYLNA